MKQNFITILKGMAMGMAEVVPGVSGGTIAFITGIYERLLSAIGSVGLPLVEGWRADKARGVWKAIDGTFLMALLIGMAFGIVVGVFGMEYLLENHPVLLWSFFFGLIIASAVYVGKQVDTWRWQEVAALILGAIIAYAITVAAPTDGNRELWFIFLAGAIAICALILPGVSGSFILLLLGLYTYIIPLIKDTLQTFDPAGLLVIAVFAAGCLTGLLSFARVMSWMFKHYRMVTLALLTGFMIGSLNKIWPWRKIVTVVSEEGERVAWRPDMEFDKVLQEANLLPQAFAEQVGDPQLVFAILSMVFGFALVFLLERVSK